MIFFWEANLTYKDYTPKCSTTIKLTIKEREQLNKYCKENGLTQSEYFRFLLKVHQIFIPFQNKIPFMNPNNKFEDKEIIAELSSFTSSNSTQKK